MQTTYDVRIWSNKRYQGPRATTHYVRWVVAGKQYQKPFKGEALADSFRSELVAAARKGEAFDVACGLPVSMARARRQELPFYTLARDYADAKWPHVAATTPRTHAEALTSLTTAMLTSDRGKPDDKLIRQALCRWAFNTARREHPDRPDQVTAALRWIETHTAPVAELAKPERLRAVLDHLTVRLDGAPAASSVVNRRRKIFNTLLEYAVERELLDTNPIPALKWKPPSSVRTKAVQAVDRRAVANPLQVRSLLEAVRAQPCSGPRLVAYFACLYFAALRPEEAGALA